MKYPTLRKVMLTTMALVASLALSAQAGRPTLSAAKQQQGKRTDAKHFPFSAQKAGGGHNSPLDFIYMLDDGTADDAIGLTAGGDEICLNEFTVVPGSETIKSVEIAWGTPVFFDPSLDGLPYTVAIWSDPNGDGNPTDAVLLTTASGVVSQQGTDTFISTDIPDTVISTANFFVGFLITQQAGQFPAAFDETNPTFSNRSYIAGSNTPGGGNINDLNANDLPVAPIEFYGLIGNWLIRATATGEGTPTPTPTPPPPGALWYNGDFDGVDGLTNEENTFATGFSHIYDDFNVPDEAGWDVHSVFSDNLASTNISSATWEIRQGVSDGNPGTLIASGMTVTPQVTATGRSGFGFIEFMVQVNDLDVHLDPGTYWLNVTPVDNLDGGRSFDSTTSGFNCIGTPCGDNANSFIDSTLFGVFFAPTSFFGGQFHDFSMGVNGEVSGGGGGKFQLHAKGRVVNGINTTNLQWRGATSSDIDVYRRQQGNGGFMLIATTPNDGSYQDSTGTTGTAAFKYQVCEAGTQNCSNKKAVLFRP
jgi:hypothetical protein